MAQPLFQGRGDVGCGRTNGSAGRCEVAGGACLWRTGNPCRGPEAPRYFANSPPPSTLPHTAA